MIVETPGIEWSVESEKSKWLPVMRKLSLTISIAILLAVMFSSCSSIPAKTVDKPPSAAEFYTDAKLSRIFSAGVQGHADKSGFILLRDGQRALRERLYLADIAEHSIDAQYYIWNSDDAGKLLMQRLLKSADRGVLVRLLLDDFCVSDRSEQLLVINSHPNIHVRVYNPFVNRSGAGKWLNFAFDFDRLNRRMHNKTYTVDGMVAIVGGRNIGDEYFGQHAQINFSDLDLFTIGPVAKQVSNSFEEYWNSAWAIPIDQMLTSHSAQQDRNKLEGFLHDDSLSETSQVLLYGQNVLPETHYNQLVDELIWAPASFVHDEPGADDKEAYSDGPKRVARHLMQLAENSQQEILIESAYFVLNEPTLELVDQLRSRGIRMRTLTNSMASNDVLPNHASYAMVRKDMLERGIELYELRPDAESCLEILGSEEYCDDDSFLSLHSKSAVFDRETVYVGSLNFNLRSAYLNTEVGMFVESSILAEQLTRQIELNMKRENSWQAMIKDNQVLWVTDINGTEESSSHEPRTTWLERAKEGLLILLPGSQYY